MVKQAQDDRARGSRSSPARASGSAAPTRSSWRAAGMRVVVNNRRRELDAQGRGSADRVVEEIRAAGGEAIADYEDVCDDGAGERLVQQALDGLRAGSMRWSTTPASTSTRRSIASTSPRSARSSR